MIKRNCYLLCCCVIFAGIITSNAFAEDIEKKWRLSFGLDSYTTQDEIKSDADNRAYYMDDQNKVTEVGVDPRPDTAATNVCQIEDVLQLHVGASYAFNSWFLIEFSAGYSKADIGDLEVTALFDIDQEAQDLLTEGTFLFRLYPLPVGELTKIPIQLSSVVRFRPKSNFNPYLGVGIGYILTEFEPSPEINSLSSAIDRSVGAFLSASYGGVIPLDKFRDLGPVTIETPESLEWHVLGGIEYTFRKNWAIFLDSKYIFAARSMRIKIDGVEKFGKGFPDGEVRLSEVDYIPSEGGEPYWITSGGGIDFNGDGQMDTGLYYVNGGDIKYGGFSLGVGIKYTF